MKGILKVLTRMQVRVCVMYFYEGKTQQQIADALGTTQTAVSKRIKRAQAALAKAGYPPMRMIREGKQNGRTIDPELLKAA